MNTDRAMTLNTLEDVRDDVKALDESITTVFREHNLEGVAETITERLRYIDHALSHIQSQQKKYVNGLEEYTNLLNKSL